MDIVSTPYFLHTAYFTQILQRLCFSFPPILFTSVLSTIILKEKISKQHVIAIAFSLIGALFLFKPTIYSLNIGAILALLASLSVSIYYVGRRKLKTYPASVIITYSTLSGLITMGVASLILENSFYSIHTSPNITTISSFIWIIMLIYALDNFVSWLFINKGFQTVKGGIGSIILLTEPVLGTMLGLVLYGETLSISSIIGIMAILLGIFIVTLKK